MAELQASWLQASSHPADTDRLVLEGLLNPAGAPVSGAAYGVGQAANDLKVQAKGTPNMSVDVLAGHGWIDGTEGANQGTYHVYNDATKNLVISAAHATLARKDLVVAKVQDAAYSGAVNAWSLAVVTGTPAGSPAEPAVPANAIVLALIDVAAAAASIVNGNITDRRRRAAALGGVVVCTSATRPAAPYVGQVIYETDTDRPMVWDGTSWKQLGLKYDPPACSARRTGATSPANNVWTKITFDSEEYDTDSMFTTGAGDRITIVTPGLYSVSFAAGFGANTTGMRGFQVVKGLTVDVNPVLRDLRAASPLADTSVTLGAVVKLAAADTLSAWVFQSSGGALGLDVSLPAPSRFSATWLGRG